MKLKLSFATNYIVKENMVIAFVIPQFNPVFYTYFIGAYDFSSEMRQKVFKGFASLKENDINDVETAKKIAKRKAMRTAYKFAAALFRERIDFLYKEVEILKSLNERAVYNADNVEKDIVDLTKKKS